MPRQKRKSKLRPKTPSRVKKRRPAKQRPRSLQHPELWGLGLVALGLFLGSVIYVGWNGGYVGTRARRRPRLPDRRRLVGRARRPSSRSAR